MGATARPPCEGNILRTRFVLYKMHLKPEQYLIIGIRQLVSECKNTIF
jgi:hypothetical protein